jgi:hypothetical protein
MPSRKGDAPGIELKQSDILPDFGMHIRAIASDQKTMLIYTSWEMDVLSVVESAVSI